MIDITYLLDQLNTAVFSADTLFPLLDELNAAGYAWAWDEYGGFQVNDLASAFHTASAAADAESEVL